MGRDASRLIWFNAIGWALTSKKADSERGAGNIEKSHRVPVALSLAA